MLRKPRRHRLAAAALLSFMALASPTALACKPMGLSPDELLSGDDGAFRVPPSIDPDKLVLALAKCLPERDPVLRDSVGYAGIAAILRSGNVDAETVRALKSRLLRMLRANDPDGFARPFAALGLAEVARVDRVGPMFSQDERAELVAAATDYVENVRDYRGFDDVEGWRHGVAHGADLLMQLVLNTELDDSHLRPIVAAALSQAGAADGHAYIFGEGQRLARPVLFAARRGVIDDDEWQALFAPLATPPGESWGDAFSSTADLAILHNTRQFLLAVYASVAESTNPAFSGTRDAARTALSALP